MFLKACVAQTAEISGVESNQWGLLKKHSPSGTAPRKCSEPCTDSNILRIIYRPENKVKDLKRKTEQVKLNFHLIPEALKILRR